MARYDVKHIGPGPGFIGSVVEKTSFFGITTWVLVRDPSREGDTWDKWVNKRNGAYEYAGGTNQLSRVLWAHAYDKR